MESPSLTPLKQVTPMRAKRWYLTKIAYLASWIGTAVLAVPAPGQVFAYATNQFYDAVSVVDTATNGVTAFIGVGAAPFAVAITPDGSRAYITNQNSASISVIDLVKNTLTATIRVGGFPSGVAVSPNGHRVYVANGQFDSVDVIDTKTNPV